MNSLSGKEGRVKHVAHGTLGEWGGGGGGGGGGGDQLPPPTIAAKAQIFLRCDPCLESVQHNGKTYSDMCCALRKLPFPPNG